MVREEIVAEISMRCDIPMEDVEEVLEQEDMIVEEELKRKKRRKCICFFSSLFVFLAGAVAAIIILDKKDKIDAEDMMKTYSDKIIKKINEIQSKNA